MLRNLGGPSLVVEWVFRFSPEPRGLRKMKDAGLSLDKGVLELAEETFLYLKERFQTKLFCSPTRESKGPLHGKKKGDIKAQAHETQQSTHTVQWCYWHVP